MSDKECLKALEKELSLNRAQGRFYGVLCLSGGLLVVLT